MSVQVVERTSLHIYEYDSAVPGKVSVDHNLSYDWVTATGTSSGQADIIYDSTKIAATKDGKTLTATSENIDLANSLVDARGNTLTFAKVCEVRIRFRSCSSGGYLKIGGGTSGAETMFGASGDKIFLGPESGTLPGKWHQVMSDWVNGFAVTATTADILKIDSGSATIVYDIIIIGRSA